MGTHEGGLSYVLVVPIVFCYLGHCGYSLVKRSRNMDSASAEAVRRWGLIKKDYANRRVKVCLYVPPPHVCVCGRHPACVMCVCVRVCVHGLTNAGAGAGHHHRYVMCA